MKQASLNTLSKQNHVNSKCFLFLIPPQTMSVHISHKHNSALTDKLILYTVVVFNLKMCIREGNPGPNYFTGDN